MIISVLDILTKNPLMTFLFGRMMTLKTFIAQKMKINNGTPTNIAIKKYIRVVIMNFVYSNAFDLLVFNPAFYGFQSAKLIKKGERRWKNKEKLKKLMD
jgi:hypothetical protein